MYQPWAPQGRCRGRDSHGPCFWKLLMSRTVEDPAVLAADIAAVSSEAARQRSGRRLGGAALRIGQRRTPMGHRRTRFSAGQALLLTVCSMLDRGLDLGSAHFPTTS